MRNPRSRRRTRYVSLKTRGSYRVSSRAEPCFHPNHAVQAQEAQGSRTIIIHPGSETLRIGRATDYSPVQVPSVIARRRRQTEDAAAVGSLKGKERASEDISMDVDVPEEDDQVC